MESTDPPQPVNQVESQTKGRRFQWPEAFWKAPRVRKMLQQLKDWMGFFAYTDPKGEYHRGKTLWDWLGLLIVPVVLAVAAIWFNQSQAARTVEIEQERAREEILHAYLTEMEGLLLNRNLLAARGNSEPAAAKSTVLIVAQVKTATALRTLDLERRDRVLQFLRDSGLADFLLIDASFLDMDFRGTNLQMIYLSGADLRKADLIGADLRKTDLTGGDLRDANLIGANLRKANLFGADLRRTFLREADLRETDLRRANLSSANLHKANLGGADLGEAILWKADLSGANLREAKVSDEKLANVSSLKGATMPDGTIHK